MLLFGGGSLTEGGLVERILSAILGSAFLVSMFPNSTNTHIRPRPNARVPLLTIASRTRSLAALRDASRVSRLGIRRA